MLRRLASSAATSRRSATPWASHRFHGATVDPLSMMLSRLVLAAEDREMTTRTMSTVALSSAPTTASMLLRCAGAQPTAASDDSIRYFSTAAPMAKKKPTKDPLPVPPNLKVDPRSSFAPFVDRKKEAEKRNVKSPPAAAAAVDADTEDSPEETVTASAVDQAEVNEQEELEEDMDVFAEEDEDIDEEIERWFQSPTRFTAIPLPDRLKVPVYHFAEPDEKKRKPEEVGTVFLDASVFGLDPIRVDLLKRAVDYHRNKKRGRRKAKTKTIGDMRGSGKKLRPQKGQGKARIGHRFAAHHRGGAKAHGPKNATDYGRTKLNRKVRTMAVRHVLSQKLKEGNIIVVNQLYDLSTHKTKGLLEWLRPFGLTPQRKGITTTGLILDDYWPPREGEPDYDETQAISLKGVPINMSVAAGNLHNVSLGNQLHGANVYDILNHDKLVLTVAAVQGLEGRLKQE